MTMGTLAPAFDLPDPKGRRHALKDFADAPALLVVFMCNHCPYVKHLKRALVDFAGKHQARGLAVVAINANDWSRYPEDSPQKMQVDIDTYGYPFPYLVDESQAVAKAYGAVCTPDFFGFDAGRKLKYRGRLDEGGRATPAPGAKRELVEAMRAIAAGREPAEQTPSIGCSIKWKAA
jgi:peroxiredoxin